MRSLVALVALLMLGAVLGTAVDRWLDRPTPAASGTETLPSTVGRVRVEVLNGGGVKGMAREATERLRAQGFDVVFYGNAGSFDQDSSVVTDRVGDLGPARLVADALGIGDVRSLPDANLYLDVTVLLGVDWAPTQSAEDPGVASDPAWWDPRGWGRRARQNPRRDPRG